MSDLTDLNAFLLVARSKGFRQAARESGVSSSALSDAVKRLEEDLGVRLFNRTTRSVLLTDAGRLLLERTGPAFAEVASALDEVKSSRGRTSGEPQTQCSDECGKAGSAPDRAAVPKGLSGNKAGNRDR